MSKILDSQIGYVGGEWSPLMDARVDHAKYKMACRQLWNMIALKQGGATRRPGTKYIGTAKFPTSLLFNNTCRLLKFQFSPETSFMLEFGQHYVRFYSNQQQVTLSSAPLWVSGTAYQAGAFVEDPGDSNRIYYCILAVTSATQPHSDPTHWVQQTIYEVPSPYSAQIIPGQQTWDADVWAVVPCQINDVVYLVHPDYPVYKLTRIADTNWTLAPVVFDVPPLLDQNTTDTTIATTGTTGSVTLTATAPAWVTATYYDRGRSVLQAGVLYECIVSHVSGTFATDLAAGKWQVQTIFQSGHVGSYWQIQQLKPASFESIDITGNSDTTGLLTKGDWSFTTAGVWDADVLLQRSLDNGTTWGTIRVITGGINRDLACTADVAALYRISIQNWVSSGGSSTPKAVFTFAGGLIGGTVQITAVGGAYSATATVIKELNATTATKYWSEGAWSTLRGYPQSVTMFQQRVIYGATAYEPQRIWGSVTNDLENFDRGDSSLSTDSFAFDLAAIGRGPIQWLIAQNDLFVGFSSAEWIVNSGTTSTAAISPVSINAVEQSTNGSANSVQPTIAGNAVLYTQRAQRTMQQMLFSIYTTRYMSQDVTSLSEHLFGGGIVQIAYQPQFRNQAIVWAITKTNSLVGMTYQLEQEILAWHRHTTGDGTDVGFESVACIQGHGTDDDEVWVVARRTVNGVIYRYIELINPNVWEVKGTAVRGVPQPEVKQAFYVDAGVTVGGPSSNVIPGFSHLVGRQVIGVLNGNITFGPLTVSNTGTVTIPNYSPVSGNQDILQIGLPINYAVQSMRTDLTTRGFIAGLNRAVSKMFIRLVNALGGNISDGTNTAPIKYRGTLVPLGQGPSIFTGEKTVQPFTNINSDDPTIIVQGNDALPLTLLAVIQRTDVVGTP